MATTLGYIHNVVNICAWKPTPLGVTWGGTGGGCKFTLPHGPLNDCQAGLMPTRGVGSAGLTFPGHLGSALSRLCCLTARHLALCWFHSTA